MEDISIDRIGHLGIVECHGGIECSEAAFELQRAVMSLTGSRFIVVDLSEVIAFEGGSLGMLVFLERWAQGRGIELRVFNPRKAVRERLDLIRSIQPINAISLQEMMSLLANENTDMAAAA
jgi:anti-anti-sigma regulatory factor